MAIPGGLAEGKRCRLPGRRFRKRSSYSRPNLDGRAVLPVEQTARILCISPSFAANPGPQERVNKWPLVFKGIPDKLTDGRTQNWSFAAGTAF